MAFSSKTRPTVDHSLQLCMISKDNSFEFEKKNTQYQKVQNQKTAIRTTNGNPAIYFAYSMCMTYRVTGLKLYLFRTQIDHVRNNFLMFQIRFHILQIMTFYDLSSFFDITKLFFHKLYFFQKKFFCLFFSKKILFSILWIINWRSKYVFIYSRLWIFMI